VTTYSQGLRSVGYLLLACSLLPGCDRGDDARLQAVRPVRAIQVGELASLASREFPGRAAARDEVVLSFQIAGPLVALNVDVGSRVKMGDVLASIDTRDLQAAFETAEGNLQRAQANLAAMEKGARPEDIERLKADVEEAEALARQAAAEHERTLQLIPSGAASKSELDIALARRESTAASVKSFKESLNIGMRGSRTEDLDAKRAEIRSLEGMVASAKNQIDYAVLKAPFDGEVAARFVNNFQNIVAKQQIVRLLNLTKIEVTVQVPESLIALIPNVEEATCKFDALPDREFTGKVTKIGSEASETTRTYPVTIEIDQPSEIAIFPGMAARVRNRVVENKGDSQGSIFIPATAVFAEEGGTQSFVWVVDEATKKVSRLPVKTGKLTAVGIEILEGLSKGQWVVIAGVHSLRDDQEVRLLTEGAALAL
jgi:RND family efflux transporter MFP subunit